MSDNRTVVCAACKRQTENPVVLHGLSIKVIVCKSCGKLFIRGMACGIAAGENPIRQSKQVDVAILNMIAEGIIDAGGVHESK